MAYKIFWNVVNGFIVGSRDNKRVTFVEWSDVKKCQYLVVFVNDAGGSLFPNYAAEDAGCCIRRVFVTCVVILIFAS
jgi:hypothetical protein